MAKSINRRISEALTGRAGTLQSDTAPGSPNTGDLWYDTNELALYTYYTDDSDVSYWVSTQPSGTLGGSGGGGSGVTTYANLTERDAVNNPDEGSLAYITSTDALYIYNGNSWDRIYVGIDEGLSWDSGGSAPSTLLLNTDGTASTITVSATDPEGFPVTYGYDVTPADQVQATISQDSSVFTLTPGDSSGLAGEFTFRTKAFDGLNTIYNTTAISLLFSIDITFSSTEPGFASTTTNSFAYSQGSPTSATTGGSRSSELRSGKYYIEIELTSTPNNALMGVARTGIADVGYNVTGMPNVYFSNGNVYPGNNSTGWGGFGNGDIFQIAYDNENDAVWFNVNNNTWYPDDPVTGSGATIGGTSGDPITLFLANGSSGGSSQNGTLTIGDGPFTYTPPTGFEGH